MALTESSDPSGAFAYVQQQLPGIIDDLKSDFANEDTTYKQDNSKLDGLENGRAEIARRTKDDEQLVAAMISNQTTELLRDQEYIYDFEDVGAEVRSKLVRSELPQSMHLATETALVAACYQVLHFWAVYLQERHQEAVFRGKN